MNAWRDDIHEGNVRGIREKSKNSDIINSTKTK
jgi:hypothetical protein